MGLLQLFWFRLTLDFFDTVGGGQVFGHCSADFFYCLADFFSDFKMCLIALETCLLFLRGGAFPRSGLREKDLPQARCCPCGRVSAPLSLSLFCYEFLWRQARRTNLCNRDFER